MTFREKLALEHPKNVKDEFCGGCLGCPYGYRYEDIKDRPSDCNSGVDSTICTKCWDREIPGTEPTEDVDMVNKPPHYTNGIECIDEMIAVFGNITVANFCLCNVWKYRKRALHKNGQEDLDKADWYMRKYIELTGTLEMMTKLP